MTAGVNALIWLIAWIVVHVHTASSVLDLRTNPTASSIVSTLAKNMNLSFLVLSRR